MTYNLNGYKAKSKAFKEMQKDDPNLNEFQSKYRGILSPAGAVEVWDRITARQEAAKERQERYNKSKF